MFAVNVWYLMVRAFGVFERLWPFYDARGTRWRVDLELGGLWLVMGFCHVPEFVDASVGTLVDFPPFYAWFVTVFCAA